MSSVAEFAEDAREALRTLLLTVEGLPPTPDIAWENRTFTPPEPKSRPWLSEVLVPGVLEAVSRGPRPLVRGEGTYFLNLHWPVADATKGVARLTGAIQQAFNPRARAMVNGLEVNIRYARADRGEVVDGWYRVPITVAWYATVQNSA